MSAQVRIAGAGLIGRRHIVEAVSEAARNGLTVSSDRIMEQAA
ncbi:hypothetical protein QA641_43500 [Bradyrhizobium sp. CB1650]|nr:hypothetical protein [Bradyrhizobium sp. CB1650]WGD52188.1 hypothetical protein QA641_43500 [Bradyrhizobium sp. CB1650]